MQKKTFIVAKFAEIQALVAAWLKNPAYNTMRDDMREADLSGEQGREGVEVFEIKPEAEWVTENHNLFLEEVRANGKICWDWELAAVLEELAKNGTIEFGEYLVELYDDEL